MLDWLIIGGGVHGTLLSHHLLQQAGVRRERLRVLDPHDKPLARWERVTASTGMEFLRSPSVHHLDVHPFALERFAKGPECRHLKKPYAWPYDRPALALFQAHVRHLVRTHGLQESRLEGVARGLSRLPAQGLRVETNRGSLEARRVVLALGVGDHPAWPDWATSLRAEGGRVEHIFSEDFHRERVPTEEDVVVVGGGITAVQLALALAARATGRVTLLSSHAMRIHQFDSDPGWLGPRFLTGFHSQRCPRQRRRTILEARHRGSIPPDVAAALRGALSKDMLAHQQGQVETVHEHLESGRVRLRLALAGDAGTLEADRIVLATGFLRSRPGGRWLDEAIQHLGLPCAPCGFPVVDRHLTWTPGLHVMGPLAELEIGPASRNISGARMGSERLVALA